jgi:hypothetical protein
MGDHKTMNKPGIVTAIPKRRYKLGEFSVVILGEIESNDGIDYHLITAVVRGTDPEPGLYLTAERTSGSNRENRVYTMRIIMRDGAEVVDASEAWHDVDDFAKETLEMVSRILNLTDEVPYRLM